MNAPSYSTDRASVVNRGLVNMRGQIKGIEKDIERDCSFIEEKIELLTRLITPDAKKGLEKQIAERMIRVDNLRDVLCVLAVYIELGEQEQRRLSAQPSLFEESEVQPMSLPPLEDKAAAINGLGWQLTLDAWAHARYDGHPDTVAAMQRQSHELRKALDTFDAAIAHMAPQEVRA